MVSLVAGEARDDGASPAEERRARRRAAILEATLAILAERGYDGATTRAIAERAQASKETLYAWFGDREGLLVALVREQSALLNGALEGAIDTRDADPAAVLEGFGVGFLAMILGERSVAINRAAIGEAARSGQLGRIVVENGRQRTGALMVRYLEQQRAAGWLACDDAGEAFGVFLGLLLRDWQIRVLLGELPAPSEEAIRARAREAVALFLRLYGAGG